MSAGPSLQVDPDLYIICMLRGPRDIIASKHKKDPDRYWASLRCPPHQTDERGPLEGAQRT